jgi:hypothetical protein
MKSRYFIGKGVWDFTRSMSEQTKNSSIPRKIRSSSVSSVVRPFCGPLAAAAAAAACAATAGMDFTAVGLLQTAELQDLRCPAPNCLT